MEAGGKNDKVTSSEEQEDRNDSIDSCCEEDERGAEAGYLLIPVPCATSTDGTEADATTFRKTPNGCAVCLSHFEVDEKITWSSNAECKHIFHQECILDWFKASGSRYCRRRWRQEQREGGTIHYTSDPRTQITSFPMNCPCCRQCFIANGEMTEKKSNLSDLSAMASTVASSISNSSSAEDAEQTLEGFVAAEAAVSSAEVPQGTEDSVVVATAAGNTTITATTPMSTVVGSEDSV